MLFRPKKVIAVMAEWRTEEPNRRGPRHGLRAVSIARSALRELEHLGAARAAVRLVFRSAVDVELPAPARLPALGLLTRRAGNLPGVVLVEDDGNLDWRRLGLRPGDAVWREGETLRLGDGMAVDLASAETWVPRQGLAAAVAPQHEIRRRLDRVAARAAVHDRQGLGCLHDWRPALAAGSAAAPRDLPALARVAWTRLARLATALRAGNEDEALAAARGLVGLGVGLTPSGDDVLLGWFGSLRLLGGVRDPLPVAGAVAARLAGAVAGRTTLVSEMFLVAGLEGEVSELLYDFVAALVGSDPLRQGDVERLLVYGGSSGVEIALGAALGVEMWLDRAENE